MPRDSYSRIALKSWYSSRQMRLFIFTQIHNLQALLPYCPPPRPVLLSRVPAGHLVFSGITTQPHREPCLQPIMGSLKIAVTSAQN